jgi:hypothetical protein
MTKSKKFEKMFFFSAVFGFLSLCLVMATIFTDISVLTLLAVMIPSAVVVGEIIFLRKQDNHLILPFSIGSTIIFLLFAIMGLMKLNWFMIPLSLLIFLISYFIPRIARRG